MRASLPVNHQLKVFFILVSAHNDLFDGGAEDQSGIAATTSVDPTIIVVIDDNRRYLTALAQQVTKMLIKVRKLIWAAIGGIGRLR